ncbi:MAG: GNAT family N-acetyltransferase [Rhodobacteraceae bacterium]|jgi:putative hemolysin|nr:GNAT family N-acetyltransferase [Paracoccaceae bacterium]
MITSDAQFTLRLARDAEDLHAAQRLRYEVFVRELGGDGPMVDHAAGIEQDAFDPYYDHLILIDEDRKTDRVVGVYRLLTDERARTLGRYYSESEYDLAPLVQSGRRLLELGRSCVHRDYRGGTAMYHLWNGLADYVHQRGIEVLFGVASFHGTDIEALKLPLSYLYHHHLAPEPLRVRARGDHRLEMDLLPPDQIDRRAAMVATPALIKAYLRVGGCVGDGAYIDREFNTTDVCLVMDTAAMSARHRDFYTRKAGAPG